MAVVSSLNDSLNNTTTGIDASSNKVTGGNSQDLQNSFLTLLVAQLKNQDPTNPMENKDLTAQLAQINTLQGIEKLNTTMGAIAGQINSNQSLQASHLIGRDVMVPGNSILVGSNEGHISATPFGIELVRSADNVTATISDRNGQLISTRELGALSAGVHAFNWDGLQTDGGAAPDGAYSVTFTANSGAESLHATALSVARVNGVTREPQGAKLDLGVRGAVSMDEVRQIL